MRDLFPFRLMGRSTSVWTTVPSETTSIVALCKIWGERHTSRFLFHDPTADKKQQAAGEKSGGSGP